tara:strand:- start:262 stop:381 length:120 start_codon:yes stop_codon:yes gene_type:complete
MAPRKGKGNVNDHQQEIFYSSGIGWPNKQTNKERQPITR